MRKGDSEQAKAAGPKAAAGAGKREARAQWWLPDLPREELRALMKRNNHHAALSHGLWLVLLGASGWLAVRLYPSGWAIPAFLLYGTLYSTCNPRWHESLHGTPFKVGWLNDVIYFFAAAMEFRDVVFARFSHLNHHAWTIMTDRDLEISTPRPVRMWKLWLDFFSLYQVAVFFPILVLHALGIPSRNARRVVPESKYGKMFWAARGALALYVAAVALAVALRSWLPVLLFGLPRIYGGVLIFLFVLPQHAGLAQNVADHRRSTRTLILGPVFSFLYMHMEYHIEHHLYPNVPFHALAKLHGLIRHRLPAPYRGLWPAWKEMIPALMRQRRDPEYLIERPVPQ